MKKQMIAFSVSAGLVISPMTAALAAAPQQSVGPMTAEAVLELAKVAKSETGVDLGEILADVKIAQAKLEAINKSKETDPVLIAADDAEFFLFSINAAAAAVHSKDSRVVTTVVLGTALSSVLESGVQFYRTMKNRGDKFDSRAMGKQIAEAVEALKQSGLEDKMGIDISASNVEEIRNSLESVSRSIEQANNLTPGEFRTKDAFQAAGALYALSTGLAHIMIPRLALSAEKAQEIAQVEANGNRMIEFLRTWSPVAAKKHSTVGSMMSNVVGGYDMVMGMNSPQVTNILNNTFDNIDTAIANLNKLVAQQKKAAAKVSQTQ